MYSRIIGTGSALPEKSLTNDEFARLLAKDGIETSDEWIRSRTGIVTRYFADPERGECTTSLAVEAAKNALEAAGVSGDAIDLIIVATTTPDMIFPSTAARVQAALGAQGCAAFDVQAVCAGFIYALNAAGSLPPCGRDRRRNDVARHRHEGSFDLRSLRGRSGCRGARIEFGPGGPGRSNVCGRTL